MLRAVTPGQSAAMLALFLVICFIIAGIGGLVTATSVDSWYATLNKPSFNPPNSVFAPVWTTLYFLIAVSGWRIWRKAGFRRAPNAFLLYGLQLAFNLAWSILFFGLHWLGIALVDALLMLVTIIGTIIAFARIDRLAAAIMVPYAAWVTFASLLNGAIWVLNP
jgi:tryptophan-rich sensory protein